MGEQADEERAKQIFEKCNKIEEQFGELFTGIKKRISPVCALSKQKLSIFLSVTVERDSLEEIYEHICEIIDEEQKVRYTWIPSKEKI